MNILLLNGSPKGNKSNTLQITNAFLNGIEATGTHTINRINIVTKHINDCAGCFNCWTKTPGKCIYRDDMDELQLLYIQADLVIWSFPLYYFGMPSKVKAVMDRMLPLNLPTLTIEEHGGGGHPSRFDLERQKQVLISTCGFHSVKNNYEALEKQFDIIYGDNLVKILCPEGELFQVEELNQTTFNYLQQVEEAGRQYGETGDLEREWTERLSVPVVEPKAYIQMANASWEMQMVSDGKPSSDSSLSFMKQMGAVCNPSVAGADKLVLEFYYTDLDKSYQFVIADGTCRLVQGIEEAFTTRIEISFSDWKLIAEGKLDGVQAMMEHKYKVTGNFDLMMMMDELFTPAAPAEVLSTK